MFQFYMNTCMGRWSRFFFFFLISPKPDKKIDKNNKHDGMIWTHILKSDGADAQQNYSRKGLQAQFYI